jgi:hypothetical protein
MKYFIALAFALAMSHGYADESQGQGQSQGQAPAPAEQQGEPAKVKEPAKEQAKESVELDQQELQLVTVDSKGKTEAPETMILKIDMKTGAKSVSYPNKTLQSGADVSKESFEDITEFDGAGVMEDEGQPASHLTSSLYQPGWSSRWWHNRGRNHSYRARFHPMHPWAPYYTHRYGPLYRYNDFYDRPYSWRYYRYQPYYHYDLGDAIYHVVRRIID